MKGVILHCVRELVMTSFGEETWSKVLERAGLPTATIFVHVEGVEDEKAIAIVKAICEVCKLSLAEVADAFGDYWVNTYAPRIYKSFYERYPSAREFILAMDTVHTTVARTLKDAKPPRFEYEWEDDRTLIIHYISHRNLVDFVVGLVKGVGRYFATPLKVEKLDEKRVKVLFPE